MATCVILPFDFNLEQEDLSMRWIHKIGLGLSLTTALAARRRSRQQQQFVNILTGGQSGVYPPHGCGTVADMPSIPNVRHRPGDQGFGRELNLLQAGRGELALALADSVSTTPGRG